MKTSSIQSIPDGKVPGLLIFGDLERKEYRLWWENLTETVREHAVFGGNLAEWLQDASACRQNSDSFFSGTEADGRATPIPDFIILLRSWSGEYSDSQILKLRTSFPLTPILAILGNWCEGEGRNGTPLVGVHSIFWYDFAAMAPLEWCAFEHDWATVWSLPSAVQPEHQVLFEQKRNERWKACCLELVTGEKCPRCENGGAGAMIPFTQPPGTVRQKPEKGKVSAEVSDDSSGLTSGEAEKARKKVPKPLKVQIESDDFDQFVLLRDFWLRNFGRARNVQVFSSWQEPADVERDHANVGLKEKNDAEMDWEMAFFFFDFPDFHEETLDRFYELKNRFPKAVRVAFTEFPRPDEWQFLRRCGVQGIFPKPFRLADLSFFCLQHWVD